MVYLSARVIISSKNSKTSLDNIDVTTTPTKMVLMEDYKYTLYH